MSLLAVAVFGAMGILFHELFVRLGVMLDIRRVFDVAPAAARVIRSPTLSDREKESAVRRMSLEVLRDTLRFTVKLALVLGACLALAVAAQALFRLSSDGLYALLVSWRPLVVIAVVVPLWARFRRRR